MSVTSEIGVKEIICKNIYERIEGNISFAGGTEQVGVLSA